MNYYLIAKFIHIVGALGLFMALGVEWLSLLHTRSATTSEQVRERLQVSRSAQRVGMPSMLVLLITGFYMMAIVRLGSAWLIVAFGALLLMVLLGLALTGPRIATIRQALTAENGPVSLSLHDLLNNPLLWLSIRTRVSIALSIVFLMTVKPNVTGSLLTIGLAIGLSLALALPKSPRAIMQKKSSN